MFLFQTLEQYNFEGNLNNINEYINFLLILDGVYTILAHLVQLILCVSDKVIGWYFKNYIFKSMYVILNEW